MAKRSARAVWEGNLQKGTGRISLESGLFKGPYSFGSRFKSAAGTNPEELIAAAHAGCFSMALSGMLSEDGYVVENIDTTASVKIEEQEGGFEITEIVLDTAAKINGITGEMFVDYADKAKEGCPVSKALKAVKTVRLNARLL
jgi:lipoyl-dependent peroxiredoxin